MYFTGFDEWRTAGVMQAKAHRGAHKSEIGAMPSPQTLPGTPESGLIQNRAAGRSLATNDRPPAGILHRQGDRLVQAREKLPATARVHT
jgi:hypothetical protein